MRAISTVLDVSLCLLLISAAVGTLALAPAGETDPVTVGGQANRLASTTADIEYTLDGDRRESHGTVASLLARAALANATIDGQAVSERRSAFGGRLRSVTRARVDAINRTEVVVCWQPYRGAPLRGTYRVGAVPPPTADVSAGTLSVPAPSPTDSDHVRSGNPDYRDVAAVAARAAVDALVPAARPTRATAPGEPVSERAPTHLRALGAPIGASISEPLSEGDISSARDRVIESLTARFTTDMRERFATPAAAADSLQTGTVRVTIRRWEP